MKTAQNSKSKTTKLGRPKGANAAQTRQRIIGAAYKMFGESGFLAATNEQIAAEAGFSAGTIYKHFDSKLDLYLQAFDEAQQHLTKRFTAAAMQADSFQEIIANVYHDAGVMFDEEPELVPFLLGVLVEVVRHPEIAAGVRQDDTDIMQQFSSWIAAGQTSGFVPAAVDPNVAVMFYIGCMTGLGVITLMQAELRMDDMVNMFMRMHRGELAE